MQCYKKGLTNSKANANSGVEDGGASGSGYESTLLGRVVQNWHRCCRANWGTGGYALLNNEALQALAHSDAV